MSRKAYRGVRRTYRGNLGSVGAALLATTLEVPQSGLIHRFRAYNPDGTGTPTLVTAEVWITDPALAAAAGEPRATFDRIKNPGAGAAVDDTEEISYTLTKVTADSNFADTRMGVLHINLATSDATLDHTVYFELEIETFA